MPAIKENFGDLLEPGLRTVFTNHFKQLPGMKNSLFNIQSSKTSYEKDTSVGAFGDMPPFTGTIQYDDINQGYDVKYTHGEFAKGFKVKRDLFDDDLYNVISRKPQGLAISARRTEEKYGASLFNTAFSGSGDITVNGTTICENTENLSLCNDSHTTTASSTTQDNKGTTALSPTAVEATRQAMAAYLDDRDNYISVQPDMLLVPRNLEETAWEIISSKGKVDTADNNPNFHYGKYKLAVWDYLTDANDWFMIDSAMMKMFLNWYVRIPLEFFQEKTFDTLLAKYAAYTRYSWGWSDWRWIYGHEVS